MLKILKYISRKTSAALFEQSNSTFTSTLPHTPHTNLTSLHLLLHSACSFSHWLLSCTQLRALVHKLPQGNVLTIKFGDLVYEIVNLSGSFICMTVQPRPLILYYASTQEQVQSVLITLTMTIWRKFANKTTCYSKKTKKHTVSVTKTNVMCAYIPQDI